MDITNFLFTTDRREQEKERGSKQENIGNYMSKQFLGIQLAILLQFSCYWFSKKTLGCSGSKFILAQKQFYFKRRSYFMKQFLKGIDVQNKITFTALIK